ncbi:hypothetical protein OH805_25595 [Streptomyces sp. NBC_00879]|uniref:hypothetical protein n=1 Tax=unclassified Streptomyces TaxID=2593676 RepID=UPI00324BB6D6|nr:hypothetical protein OHA61_37110 [Streptomyces sp. NBC_00885]WSY77238.1 hypothetical protein OH805_25595 [Streptomyces sp. NBC_00879]
MPVTAAGWSGSCRTPLTSVRHNTWIGPPDIDQPAVDLAQLPEVVDAQRRHRRMRRYGWEATYDAVLTAS